LAAAGLSLAHTELYASYVPSSVETPAWLDRFDTLVTHEADPALRAEGFGKDGHATVWPCAHRVVRKANPAIQREVKVRPNSAAATRPAQYRFQGHHRTPLHGHGIEVRIQRRDALRVIEKHDEAVGGKSTARLPREPHASWCNGQNRVASGEVKVEGVCIVRSQRTIYPRVRADIVRPDDSVPLAEIPWRSERKARWKRCRAGQ